MSINECREIYREAFGSDGEFENRLFTCCFKYCERSASAEKPHQCFLHSPAIFITPPRLFPLIIFSPQPQKRNFAEMDI